MQSLMLSLFSNLNLIVLLIIIIMVKTKFFLLIKTLKYDLCVPFPSLKTLPENYSKLKNNTKMWEA